MKPRAPIGYDKDGLPKMAVTYGGKRWLVLAEKGDKVTLLEEGQPMRGDTMRTVRRTVLGSQLKTAAPKRAADPYGTRYRKAHKTGS